MAQRRMQRSLLSRRALLGAGLALPLAARAQRPVLPVGLLTQADDPRYGTQALLDAYPDAPGGRAQPAMQMALNDSTLILQLAGWDGAQLLPVEAADADGVAGALLRLLRQGARHVLLELPAAGVVAATAAAAGKDVMLLNTAAPEDALRGEQCAASLLHTLPSRAMQMDAIAQLLAARGWLRPLVLAGETPGDTLLLAAWQRAERRARLQPVALRSFGPGGADSDPDAPRRLTSGLDYDAVVVLDAGGAFARALPYRTALPRPVLGSDGLTAQAWHPLDTRAGAPQLSRRFLLRAGRPMGSYDWAAYAAARAAAQAAAVFRKVAIAGQLQALHQGAVTVEGAGGEHLSFRAWDGQLRQPLLLAHGDGIAAIAPLPGFAQGREPLDSLGHDAAGTACRPT